MLLFVCFLSTSLLAAFQPCPARVLAAFPQVVGREFRPRAIALTGTGFRGRDHENAVFEMYTASLDYTGQRPSKRQVCKAIQNIAAETDRSAALSFTTGFTEKAAERTRAKIDLRTGDFLIVDHLGRVAAFTRLPIGRRALGKIKDLHDFSTILSSYTFADDNSHPRLAAGEDLGDADFSPHNRNNHFDKHVLGCRGGLSLLQWLRRYKEDFFARNTSFPALRGRFASALHASSLRRESIERVYRDFVNEYETRAKKFLRSKSPTALSSTAIHRMGNAAVLNSIKFDVQTLELAIVNRQDQLIVTYFRVSDLVPSNHQLRYSLRAEPVETALEYFLVLALSEHVRP